MKKLIVMIVAVFVVTEVAAHHFYSKFPITLKGYTGDKTNSVAYTGQIARHVLHDSPKQEKQQCPARGFIPHPQGDSTRN